LSSHNKKMDFFELKLFKIKVKGIIEEVNETIKIKDNQKYTRLSSQGQKWDLERQTEYMKAKYPNHLIISD